MGYFAGIDVGSVYCKGVIFENGRLAGSHVTSTGSNYRQAAEQTWHEILRQAGIKPDEISGLVATGVGMRSAFFAQGHAGDIICTARGINMVLPEVRTVFEVAGQSSKIIKINPHGQVVNFTVSEKCATGSGRFVDVIAHVLRVDLNDFGPLSLKSDHPVSFSTGCAVFGESEAITRVSEGFSKQDIAAGVNKSLAVKIASMARKMEIEKPCAVCGGGALNSGLIKALNDAIEHELVVAPEPQLTAARGAAILARSQTAAGLPRA
ncbi:MAG: acyl-CoA dehydratase activase [Pseudomonadota bacterium]